MQKIKYISYKNYSMCSQVHSKTIKIKFKMWNLFKLFANKIGNCAEPEADFFNMKTRGFLSHPSRLIFLIVKEFESCFVKHADSINVFDDTFDEFLQNFNFKLQWGCAKHKSQVMTNIYVQYIVMRMRQYTYAKNQEHKKQNNTKKKLAKLVST